jgi:hypothetical protein
LGDQERKVWIVLLSTPGLGVTAVAEVMYEHSADTGLWHYAGLDDFDLNDVQALRRGKLAGQGAQAARCAGHQQA